ncbi:uncharacterized protein J3D65DRAFT_639481 [Phyllosticta citribraziliensis]|uniref:Secreted protein n=1 Tax=Phyllosticta citribraziliensis TaxID=989973 RepID=A0ABR1L8L8_9PEZI
MRLQTRWLGNSFLLHLLFALLLHPALVYGQGTTATWVSSKPRSVKRLRADSDRIGTGNGLASVRGQRRHSHYLPTKRARGRKKWRSLSHLAKRRQDYHHEASPPGASQKDFALIPTGERLDWCTGTV